jgi:hypothetical protein
LRRLVAKGRIRFVGTVYRALGRPEFVFCRWPVKEDNLRHEIELTDLCLRIDASEIRRGPHVTDTRIRPDAELSINGQTYYLEHDRGTMGYGQITNRFGQYEGFPHFVLWVCSTPERREGLRTRAVALRHCALFTTFTEALRSPHDSIWLDFGGEKVALPSEGGREKS